jgi:hypothetical protein
MKIPQPNILKDPARLALGGALVLLLAWSVDNLVRHRLDETAQVISRARQSIADQEREADLRESFQAAQRSIGTVQQLVIATHPSHFPIFNPRVLQLISRQSILERYSLALAVTTDRASAAEAALNVPLVERGTRDTLARLALRLRELTSAANSRDSTLAGFARGLQTLALAGQPYSRADENEVMLRLKEYEQDIVPVVSEAEILTPLLDGTVRAALNELEAKRRRLESWSTAIGWLYVLFSFPEPFSQSCPKSHQASA